MLSCEYVHMRITYTYLAHFLKPLSGRLHQVPKLPIILTVYIYSFPHYFPNY